METAEKATKSDVWSAFMRRMKMFWPMVSKPNGAKGLMNEAG